MSAKIPLAMFLRQMGLSGTRKDAFPYSKSSWPVVQNN